MAEIKKCSICGMLYHAYNHVDIPVSRENEEEQEVYDEDGELINYELTEDLTPINFQPNGFEFVTIKEDMDVQYDFENQDLCPECMAAISNFIETNTPHASGNPVVLEDAAPERVISISVTGGNENTTITRECDGESRTYSLGDPIYLLTGTNTLTASEGTIDVKYKKAIET